MTNSTIEKSLNTDHELLIIDDSQPESPEENQSLEDNRQTDIETDNETDNESDNETDIAEFIPDNQSKKFLKSLFSEFSKEIFALDGDLHRKTTRFGPDPLIHSKLSITLEMFFSIIKILHQNDEMIARQTMKARQTIKSIVIAEKKLSSKIIAIQDHNDHNTEDIKKIFNLIEMEQFDSEVTNTNVLNELIVEINKILHNFSTRLDEVKQKHENLSKIVKNQININDNNKKDKTSLIQSTTNDKNQKCSNDSDKFSSQNDNLQSQSSDFSNQLTELNDKSSAIIFQDISTILLRFHDQLIETRENYKKLRQASDLRSNEIISIREKVENQRRQINQLCQMIDEQNDVIVNLRKKIKRATMKNSRIDKNSTRNNLENYIKQKPDGIKTLLDKIRESLNEKRININDRYQYH